MSEEKKQETLDLDVLNLEELNPDELEDVSGGVNTLIGGGMASAGLALVKAYAIQLYNQAVSKGLDFEQVKVQLLAGAAFIKVKLEELQSKLEVSQFIDMIKELFDK